MVTHTTETSVGAIQAMQLELQRAEGEQEVWETEEQIPRRDRILFSLLRACAYGLAAMTQATRMR